jgi:hypothetical protein
MAKVTREIERTGRRYDPDDILPTGFGDEYSKWSEGVEFDRSLAADETIAPHFGHVVGVERFISPVHHVTKNTVLDHFALLASRREDVSHVDWAEFDQRYYELETFFYEDQLTLEEFGFLENCTFNAARCEFDDDLSIDCISKEDFERGLREFPELGVVFLEEFSQYFDREERIRITRSRRLPKTLCSWSEYRARFAPYETADGRQLSITVDSSPFRNALTALRLATGCEVCLSFAFTRLGDYPFHRRYAVRTELATPRFRPFSTRNVITDSHVAEARTLYSRIRKPPVEWLQLPLRWFNSAMARDNGQDKVLDLAIAFESLYLSELSGISDTRERGELKFRTAILAAFLLGDDAATRRAVFAKMRDFYDSRSRIVHGSVLDPGKLDAAVAGGKDLLIRSLKAVINGRSKGQDLAWQSFVFGQ